MPPVARHNTLTCFRLIYREPQQLHLAPGAKIFFARHISNSDGGTDEAYLIILQVKCPGAGPWYKGTTPTILTMALDLGTD